MTWALSAHGVRSQRHSDHPHRPGDVVNVDSRPRIWRMLFGDRDPRTLAVALAMGLEVKCELIHPTFSGSSRVPLRAVAERRDAGPNRCSNPATRTGANRILQQIRTSRGRTHEGGNRR
jgi:hypothetical protein